MEVADVVVHRGHVVIEIVKPTGSDTKAHLINSGVQVGPNRFGSYLFNGPLPIATNSTSGDVGPVDDSWLAGSGTVWQVLGQIQADRALAVRNGGGGGGGPSPWVPINVTQVGGNDGDLTTPASWTYTVKDSTDAIDYFGGNPVDPTAGGNRFTRDVGKVIPATHGILWIQPTGNIERIIWVDEKPRRTLYTPS